MGYDKDDLLTLQQAAKLLGFKSYQAVYVQLVRTGQIPVVRIGRTGRLIRFLKSDLDAYVASRRVPAKEAADAS